MKYNKHHPHTDKALANALSIRNRRRNGKWATGHSKTEIRATKDMLYDTLIGNCNRLTDYWYNNRLEDLNKARKWVSTYRRWIAQDRARGRDVSFLLDKLVEWKTNLDLYTYQVKRMEHVRRILDR